MQVLTIIEKDDYAQNKTRKPHINDLYMYYCIHTNSCSVIET
jgi:hypothetical protein